MADAGRSTAAGSARHRGKGGAARRRTSCLHPRLAERWLDAFSAVLADMSAADAHGLEGTAQLLAAHGAVAIPGAQCVISVTTPQNPDRFTVVAGAGEWASRLTGTDWRVEGAPPGPAMLRGDAPADPPAPHRSSAPCGFFRAR